MNTEQSNNLPKALVADFEDNVTAVVAVKATCMPITDTGTVKYPFNSKTSASGMHSTKLH